MSRHFQEPATVMIGRKHNVQEREQKIGPIISARYEPRQQPSGPIELVRIYNGPGNFVEAVPRGLLRKFSSLASRTLPKLDPATPKNAGLPSSTHAAVPNETGASTGILPPAQTSSAPTTAQTVVTGGHPRTQRAKHFEALILGEELGGQLHPSNTAIKEAIAWMRRNAAVKWEGPKSAFTSFPESDLSQWKNNDLAELYIAAILFEFKWIPKTLQNALIARIPDRPSAEFMAWNFNRIEAYDVVMREIIVAFDKAHSSNTYTPAARAALEAYISAEGNEDLSKCWTEVERARKMKYNRNRGHGRSHHKKASQAPSKTSKPHPQAASQQPKAANVPADDSQVINPQHKDPMPAGTAATFTAAAAAAAAQEKPRKWAPGYEPVEPEGNSPGQSTKRGRKGRGQGRGRGRGAKASDAQPGPATPA